MGHPGNQEEIEHFYVRALKSRYIKQKRPIRWITGLPAPNGWGVFLTTVAIPIQNKIMGIILNRRLSV